MTLQAHFHLALRVELSRIHDGAAYLRNFAARVDGFYVIAARAVTALAVYPARKRARKHRFAAAKSRARGKFRIPVMAENALVSDPPAKSLMVRPVIAGVHSPIAALRRILSQRKLH